MANQAGKIRETEQSVLNQSFDTDFNQLAVELLGYNPANGKLYRQNVDDNGNPGIGYTTQLDYAGGANPVYLGVSIPGTATSAANWQIRKISYTAGNPTAIQYAGGVNTFTNVWDNRASLSYS